MVFNTNTVNVAGKKGKYLFVYFFAPIKTFKLFFLKRHTVFSINIPLLMTLCTNTINVEKRKVSVCFEFLL